MKRGQTALISVTTVTGLPGSFGCFVDVVHSEPRPDVLRGGLSDGAYRSRLEVGKVYDVVVLVGEVVHATLAGEKIEKGI